MQMGVTDICKPVQGNFLKMPFEKETFDGAYAIEATCHANKARSLARAHFSFSATKSMFGTLSSTPDPALSRMPMQGRDSPTCH